MQVQRLLVVLVVLQLILSSCGAPSTALPTIPGGSGGTQPTDTTSSGGKTTISIAVYDYDRVTYTDLMEQFQTEHPDINVVIVPLDDLMQTQPNADGLYPTESPTDYLRKVASGADVFPAYFLTPEALGTPLVLNLEPFLEADTSGVSADYFPGVLERFRTDQGFFQLPRSINIQSVAYNQELFTANGIAAPSSEWSAEDFFATAERLAKIENGTITRYGWFDNSGGSTTMLYLADMAGFDLFDASQTSPKNNEKQIIDLYRQYKDLVDRGVVLTYNQMIAYADGKMANMPTDMPAPTTDPVQLIKDGKIGMWMDSTIYDPNFASPFTLNYVAMPSGSQLRMTMAAEGYAASGGTQSPLAAWILMEWLSRQVIPSSYVNYDYPGFIMARKSLHEQMFTSDDATSTARIQSYQDTLTLLPRYTASPLIDYTIFWSLANGTSRMFESPPKTPAEAFAVMLQEYTDMQNNTMVTPSPTADVRPVVVATPAAQMARPDQVTVNYAAYGYSPADIRRQLRGLAEAYPDIYVNVVSTDNFTSTVTIRDIAARADCFWWSSSLPGSDADVAALADLRPLVDSNPDFALDDYAPAIVDFLERDGRLLGIPQGYSTRGVVYNPDLFAKVGIDAPQSDWTPEEFLSASRALTGNGVYGYSSLGNYLGDIEFWTRQFGGTLSRKDGDQVITQFGDPKTVAAISWYLELATKHKVMPMPAFYYRQDVSPTTDDPSFDLQNRGLIGMWFDAGLGSFVDNGNDPNAPKPAFVAKMAPLPTGTQGVQSADYSVSAWYISATSQQANACLNVIDYLSSTAASTNTMYGYIPAQTSVAESPDFTQNNSYMVPLYEALKTTLANKKGIYNGDASSVYAFESYWLYEAFDAIVYKQADPTTALKRAEKLTNSYQACIVTNTDQGIDYAKCALEADPDYKGYLAAQPGVMP